MLDGLAPTTVADGAQADESKPPRLLPSTWPPPSSGLTATRELLRELASLFRGDCPQRMAEIRHAIVHRDGPRLESAAHYLKGSAGNLGSRPAFEAVGRLERDGRERNLGPSGGGLGRA